MRERNKQFNNAGFTLIEVLIAIAILAIISLPLLNYFSDALKTAANGRRNQRAEMAGQSIIEELTSYRKHKDLDKAIAATGGPWKVDTVAEAEAAANPEPSPTPDPTNPSQPVALGARKYLIKEDLEIDGVPMIAKVKLDFNYAPASSSIIKYNNFEVPQINALYSEQSAVVVDNGDSLDYAVSNFKIKEKGLVDEATIKNKSNLKRTGYIDVQYKRNSKGEVDNNVLVVKAYYKYENINPNSHIANTLDKTYQAPYLINTEVLKEDFKYIYVLFNEMEDTDDFVINFDPALLQTDLDKIGLYFICQTHENYSDAPAPHSHSLNLSGSQWCQVYTNNHNVFGTSNSDTTYIKKEKEERIANVIVDIYKKTETTFDETTRIARIVSSKGE